MSAPSPLRLEDDPQISQLSTEVRYVNLGDGEQANYDQSGGQNNQHFNARKIVYNARKETPPLPKNTVPFPRDDGFVDRPELAELQQKLSISGSRVVLTGLGGIGRSQLAIEYCYRTHHNDPNIWVLWIHSSSAARFDQDVRRLADDVQIPERHEENADIFQLVYGWLGDARRRWLIVLDNADDVGFLFEPPASKARNEDVNARPRIEYLPPREHGAILITTRNGAAASKLADAHRILKITSSKELAIALLESKLGKKTDSLLSERLAVALEYLPLAITQAAAYITRRFPRCTAEAYLAMLHQSDDMKVQLLSNESAELRRDIREASNSVLRSWRISFEYIHHSRRSAADMLSVMSFYNHQNFPDLLLRSIWADLEHKKSDHNTTKLTVHNVIVTDDDWEHSLESDLDLLRDYSFISVTPGGLSFQMHRLVQLAAQVWLKEQDKYQQFQTRSLRVLASTLPSAEIIYCNLYQTFHPHTAIVFQMKPTERKALLSLSDILFKAAYFTGARGLYGEAEALVARSKEIQEAILSRKNFRTMNCTSLLASIYRQQQRSEAAEVLEVELLETSAIMWGPEHPKTLRYRGHLSLIHGDQKGWQEAQKLQVPVIEKCKEVYGAADRRTLDSINCLAVAYAQQNLWDEAKGLLGELVKTSKIVLGPLDSDTLRYTSNLAHVYLRQDRWAEAEELLIELREIHTTWLGSERFDTQRDLESLAYVYMCQARWEEAYELLIQILSLSKNVLGPEHRDTIRIETRLKITQHHLEHKTPADAQSNDGRRGSRGNDVCFSG